MVNDPQEKQYTATKCNMKKRDTSDHDHSEVLQCFMLSTDHKKSLNYISEFLQRNVIHCESFERGCDAIEQIIQVLLCANFENDLKKGIVNSIMKIPRKWHPQLFAGISHYLNEFRIPNSLNEYDKIRCYFENLVVLLSNSVLSQNFLVADFSHIVSTYESVLCQLSTSNLKLEPTKVKEIEIAELYHFLIQTLIVFVDESCKYKSSVDFPYTLYLSIRNLMSNDKLNINTINNCGLLIVTLNYNFFDVSSSLLLLKQFSEKSPIQCLAICHGYLASASLEFYISSSPDNLLEIICNTVWLIYSEHANDSLIVVGVLKIILLLTKNSNLENHDVPNNCIRRLIGLLLSHLDHCLNSAKNLSKEALNQLIQQKNEFVISELLAFIRNTRHIDRKSCVVLTALSGITGFPRISTTYKRVIEDLQNAARNAISSSYVCHAYLSLMISDYSDKTVHDWFDLWMKPLLVKSSDYNLLLEHILIPVVKISDVVSEKFMKYCRYVNHDNYSIIVKFLLETRTSNSSKVVDVSKFSQLDLNSNYWKNLLPFEVMIHAVCVPNSADALTTANLIVESIKGNDIFTSEEIDLLKFFIDSQLVADKSEFRCKFLNLLNQLFDKISLYLNSKNPNSKAKHIENFVSWIILYLLSNIFPGASYERRYSALRICKIIIDRNLWPQSLMNINSMKIFFNGLRDGFEENERIAKHILLRFFSQKPDLMNGADKVAVYIEAIEMIGGMRFPEHDTAAYLLEILCCMTLSTEYFLNIVPESEVENIIESFRNEEIREEDSYIIHLQILVSKLKVQLGLCKKGKIIKYPLHGFLHVIRHLLNNVPLKNQKAVDTSKWKVLIDDIIQISISCNEFADFIVSHSSPEGYLPNEVNDEKEHVFSVAQQTLLCNWRTVKGASLLLGDLVEKFSNAYTCSSKAYLEKRTFLKIGEHLKTLICNITHKGSFKQVYIALFQYCNRCWRSPDSDINALPKQWLKEIENMIVHHTKKLCFTRRSAGIPCIVLAIFCTEFVDKRKFTSNLLNEFMESMFEIVSNESAAVESKIHVLNIVRDLFVHKDMAEQINNYTERAVIVAINGFKSSNWNERNTSNLLLSAVLTRIFGVSRSRTDISWKNRMTGKIFFHKYPLLFDIFLTHLQQSERENINVQSAVYPILLILARLYSSYHDEWNDTFQLTTFVPYIYNCSENSICKIRQLTVQAIVPFITRDIYVEHCHKIWSDVMQPLPENTKHGLLLQLESLLNNIPELNEKQNEDLTLLSIRIFLEANSILQGNHSFMIKEKLLIILSSLSKRYYCVIDFSKMKNYPLNESTLNSPIFQFNQQNFIAASCTFNVTLRYLESLKKNDPFSFINLLERMIQQHYKTNKQNPNIVLDFVVEVASVKKLSNENIIIRDLISNHSKDVYKEVLLKSKVIYLFLLNQLLDNKTHRAFEILHVLPEFLKQSQERSPIELLASFSKKYLNNTKLVMPFLSCVDTLLEKQNCWNDECSIVVKSLLFSYKKLCRSDQQKMRQFFFKYSGHFLDDDIYLALDVWTFVVEQISNTDEKDFIFFKHTSNDFFDFSKYEDHFLMAKLMQMFCCNFQSTPLFCIVGLISWIIKDLGFILNDLEKNDLFLGDLPDFFEDHLLICEFSFKYLNILLERFPSIMNEYLPPAALSWILKQGGLKEEWFNSNNTIRDLISSVISKFENIVPYKSFKTSRFAFLTHETVEERITEIKLSLLITLLNRIL